VTNGAPQRPLFSRGLNYDSDFDEGEGREKVRCDRAKRFGRGPASVLCSWEVVKAEVQFSANQSLFPSGSSLRKRNLKRVSGKREVSSTV
jgi:hypothetical protein